MSGEEEAEKFDQHDGLLAVENARDLEEDKALEPAAKGKDKTEILMVAGETGAPHDDENEAAKLADAIVSVLRFAPQKQLTKEQENPPIDSQEVTNESYVAQEPKFSLEAQGVPSQFELGSGLEINSKEIEQLVEASEMKEENVSSQPASEEYEDGVIENDINPLKQSIGNAEETEDMSATTEADNVAITGQTEMSKEDDDTDEADITDKGEKNSEGTGDSPVEYNAEPIWPAESLEELSMDLTEEKLDDQEEKQQAEENKASQTEEKFSLNNVKDCGINVKSLQNINEGKDNSKMAFLEKYMLGLVEQKDQQANSRKLRILDLTRIFMVLLWPFCFWHFGLPFLKISLVVVLVILLSNIQST